MSRSALLIIVITLLCATALASPYPSWAQRRDSPYAQLFRRETPVPAVGSDAWTALYPPDVGTPTTVPQSWIDALDAAVAAGIIPNISVSAVDSNGFTTYPDGDPNDAAHCSFTYQCNVTTDLINPPDGIIALSFDDGPTEFSDTLYAFLAAHNQHATHFMIGANILDYPQQFLQAFQVNQDHLAVHTWSHPYLTTKNNTELLAEFGWAMQIMSDSTGGLIPSCYRPPYGDTDMRVRAIAQHVFGLRTVTWNQDSQDWAIGTDTTLPAVEASLETWVTGAKSPGLLALEHELTNDTIAAFMYIYPMMLSSGWSVKTVADAFDIPWYANGANSSVPPAYSLGIASPIPLSSSTASVSSGMSRASATTTGSSKTGSSTAGSSTAGSSKTGSSTTGSSTTGSSKTGSFTTGSSTRVTASTSASAVKSASRASAMSPPLGWAILSVLLGSVGFFG